MSIMHKMEYQKLNDISKHFNDDNNNNNSNDNNVQKETQNKKRKSVSFDLSDSNIKETQTQKQKITNTNTNTNTEQMKNEITKNVCKKMNGIILNECLSQGLTNNFINARKQIGLAWLWHIATMTSQQFNNALQIFQHR